MPLNQAAPWRSLIAYCSARGVVMAASVCLFIALMNPAQSDQNAPELPALFEQLAETDSAADARRIEARIWQHWLQAPDENASLLSSQLSLAMQEGRMEIALGLANQLVDSNPDYAEGWNRRATLHYLMGNDDLSVADIRETLAREPRHFGAISGLGLIFLRQGDLEAALGAFEQVLEISPASENARRSVERVKRELGREI